MPHVRQQFPRLFTPRYVPWANADVAGTLDAAPAGLVHSVHLVAQTEPGLVTVCGSSQGWRFLPGGRLEPGEVLTDAVARELEEEAGLRPLGEVTYFFSDVATCRSAEPYMPHVPHPITWWTYGVCRAEIVGEPTSPVDAEQIVEVHHLPIEEAAKWLAVTDAGQADVVRLAAALGMLT